jgi:hypothetical protein
MSTGTTIVVHGPPAFSLSRFRDSEREESECPRVRVSASSEWRFVLLKFLVCFFGNLTSFYFLCGCCDAAAALAHQLISDQPVRQTRYPIL